jgi:hypothetical protein
MEIKTKSKNLPGNVFLDGKGILIERSFGPMYGVSYRATKSVVLDGHEVAAETRLRLITKNAKGCIFNVL